MRVSVFLTALIAGVGRAQVAGAEPGPVDVSWLYVVQGDVVDVSGTRLTIAADDRALAFSERPQRAVRFVDLERLLADAWAEDGDFRRDPPNASLIDVTDGIVGIIEITEASYAGGRMTLTFVRLEGSLPAKGSRVAITIDSHAEGDGSAPSGSGSHAEGDSTDTGGSGSHAEGQN